MNELLDQAVERLSEAMGDAALLIAAYLERTSRPRQTACKEVADRAGMPELWEALEKRVFRIQEKARSNGDSGGTTSGTPESTKGSIRGAKSVMRRHPELAAELLTDPDVMEAVTTAVASNPTATAQVASKTTKPAVRKSSAGTDKGIVGAFDLVKLLDDLDKAVLVIEDRLPEFTAALREGRVPNGEAIAEEWHNKLNLAGQLLELATLESI